MAAEKSVTVAKQSLRASLRSEISGENRSGGGAPVKIKGLDDDEEEHEHSWSRQTSPEHVALDQPAAPIALGLCSHH